MSMVNKGKFRKVMQEFKRGSLHSGSKRGPKVRSAAQAKAIAASESRYASGGTVYAHGGSVGGKCRGTGKAAKGKRFKGVY